MIVTFKYHFMNIPVYKKYYIVMEQNMTEYKH